MLVRSASFEEPGLKQTWNRLLSADNVVSKTYFQTWEWNSTWWEIYGRKDRCKTLLLLQVTELDSVIAIAPFILQSRRIASQSLWEHIVWLGFDLSPYPDIITQRDRVQEVWDSLFSYCALKHSSAWFEFQDVYSFSTLSLVKIQSKIFFTINTDVCLKVYCKNQEELLNGSNALRRKQRQVLKLLESNSSIQWLSINDQRFLPLTNFAKLSILRFGRKSFLAQKDNYAFVSNLLSKDPNRIIYFLVKEHDEILHCILCFWLNDTVHYFLAGMNREARNLQPGFINLFHTLPYLHAEGIKVFDFGKGRERYKLDFIPEMSESKKFVIVSKTSIRYYRFAMFWRRFKKVRLIFSREIH